MKKFTILLFSLLFIVGSVLAQKTNDGKGSKNKKDGGKPKDRNDGRNDGGGGGGGNGNNACVSTGLQLTSILFGAYQSQLISSSRKRPWVSSFELLLHGGTATGTYGTYITALPRVRLNYGALSADVRYNYYTKDSSSFSFVDALAEFNIISGNGFKMSIGQGIMYSVEGKKTYHESFVGMDLGFLDRSILISPEFRLAYDWDIAKSIVSEVTMRAGYRVFNSSNFVVYANVSGGYQYMHQGVSSTLINGGLDIFIQ